MNEVLISNLNPEEIFPKHKCSLDLEHNPHRVYHETVEAHEKTFLTIGFTIEELWVSPLQRQLSIQAQEFWSLLWYPDTPIGFHRLFAYDLNTLLQTAKAMENKNI
jgi:hypothetical protein